MAGLVTDTHAVIWYLQLSPRLSATARAAIKTAISGGDPVYVSSISLVEIAYLTEKNRLPPDTLDLIVAALGQPNSGLLPIARSTWRWWSPCGESPPHSFPTCPTE